MAAKEDYIPSNDAEFCAWMGHFVSAVGDYAGTFGATAEDVGRLGDALAAFDSAVTDYVAKQAQAKAAVGTKKMRRAELEKALRTFVRWINNHPAMTNDIRSGLGLHVPDGTRTRSVARMDVPGMLLEALPGIVVVHFGTSPGNELLNGKPDWAKGCNIYRRKAGETDFSLIAFDTSSPYLDAIRGPATDVTYRVAYRATRENDIGPMCPDQTIAAGG